MQQKRLYLFTATYPYGRSEVFLDDELPYLCKAFAHVVIVPLTGKNGSNKRYVPDNCDVLTPIIQSRRMQYIRGVLCPMGICEFFRDFFVRRVWSDRRKLKTWLIGYVLTNNLLASRIIKSLFMNIQPTDVCYFYWGKGANVLSYYYKGKARFVSRFHGEWDLWEESSGNYAPIRKLVAESLGCATLISKNGKAYFESHYPMCRTSLNPLGTPDQGEGRRSSDGILRVVSCSAVYPLKRVPLILEAIKLLDHQKVQWTHLGGGQDLETLKLLAKNVQSQNIEIELKGQMTHGAVIKYYQSHEADVFVNVSTNEGVPVSIMEALSFGIPVVATNVGGNSDIVTTESGVLLSANPSAKEVADAICQVHKTKLDPRGFWKRHYSADVNYGNFATMLKNI